VKKPKRVVRMLMPPSLPFLFPVCVTAPFRAAQHTISQNDRRERFFLAFVASSYAGTSSVILPSCPGPLTAARCCGRLDGSLTVSPVDQAPVVTGNVIGPRIVRFQQPACVPLPPRIFRSSLLNPLLSYHSTQSTSHSTHMATAAAVRPMLAAVKEETAIITTEVAVAARTGAIEATRAVEHEINPVAIRQAVQASVKESVAAGEATTADVWTRES